MAILVTGGCGYIGAHTIVDLIENGYQVSSVDNNINSDESLLSGIEKITKHKILNYQIDLCDLEQSRAIFKEQKIEGVIHFAALKSVPESVVKPFLYYKNNLESLLNVLTLIDEFEVPYFVFSSSCSVYGNASDQPVTEHTQLQKAESPYAHTKAMCEQIIIDWSSKSHCKSFMLRYFNPAGAHPSNLIGQVAKFSLQNLVPAIVNTAMGRQEKMIVQGNDYPTRDGSCIRDYVHVCDIAKAHTLALNYLKTGKLSAPYDIINLGSGVGVTVLEAVHSFEKMSGKKLNYFIEGRRFGDVVAVYADNTKAKKLLEWVPQFTLDEIMDSCWKWENAEPF
jgi:UDP-glucose 4-epimerase